MRDEVWGVLLVALFLGGIVLLARRRTELSSPALPHRHYRQGNIRVVADEEPPRYKNKEIRRIEYNADGLPTLIEITRDYAIA